MIQRIQSLYLLIAAVLMAMMAVMPIAEFYGVNGENAEELVLKARGFESVTAVQMTEAETGSEPVRVRIIGTMAMWVIVLLAAALPFVTIFLFKKRMLQFRLCASEMILLIGAQLFAILYTVRAVKSAALFDDVIYSLKLPFFFPVIASLFIWLAIRGIKKDIVLLKSLDRIR